VEEGGEEEEARLFPFLEVVEEVEEHPFCYIDINVGECEERKVWEQSVVDTRATLEVARINCATINPWHLTGSCSKKVEGYFNDKQLTVCDSQ
jgi:hypothetical protein